MPGQSPFLKGGAGQRPAPIFHGKEGVLGSIPRGGSTFVQVGGLIDVILDLP